MQQRIEAVISARFDQLLGKERIEQEMEESARKIASIGSRAAQSVANDVISQVPQEKVSPEDLKTFDKIQKEFETSGRIIDKKSATLIEDFEKQKSFGLTESQWKSYEKKFAALGDETNEEMRTLEHFIKELYSGGKKQEYLEQAYKLWDTGERTPENIERIKELTTRAKKEEEREEPFDMLAAMPGKLNFTKDYQEHIRKSKAYEKVLKFEEEGEEFLSGFERKRTKGMTETQAEKYDDKFSAFKERIEDFQTKILPKYDLPETEQSKVEQSLKQLTENATKSYGLIKNSIEETITTQDSFFKQLQQAGYITMASGVLNQAGKIATASVSIEAKERTAFDFSSPVAMYTEQQQYELYKQNTERSVTAASAGMLIGGIAGGYLGGPAGALMGGSMMSSFGSQIADIFNIENKGKLDEEIKLLQQGFELSLRKVEEFRQYEIEATKLGNRFSGDLRGSSDLGYTLPQELSYKHRYGENARRFEENNYEEQLAFARETGLSPEEVFRLNRYTPITGQKYSGVNLESIKQYSKEIFGESADNKRVLDILEKIAELNVKALEFSANAESREISKLAAFPTALFGIDNSYGRLGDLGQKTISDMEPLAQPSSTAHEAFLFRAYSNANDGQLLGPNGWIARRDSGLFYSPTGKLEDSNFKYILDQLSDESRGEKAIPELILDATIKKATPELRERLAKIAAGEPINIVTGYAKNSDGKYLDESGEVVETEDKAKKIYRTITGKDELMAYMRDTGKKMFGDNLSEQQRQETIDALFGNAKKSASAYEVTEERISRMDETIAKKWELSMLKIQEQLAEKQQKWLTSGETMRKVLDKVTEGFEHLDERLRKYGVVPQNATDTKNSYYKKAYNELYERAYTFLNNSRGFDSSVEISDEQLKKKIESGGRSIEDYEKQLAKIMAAPTSFLRGREKENVDPERYEYWLDFLKKDANRILLMMEKELKTIKEVPENKTKEELAIEKMMDRKPDSKVGDLGKNWRENAIKKVNEQLANKGYSAKMISGYRTPEEQEKLISSEKRKGVEDSSHLSGHAFDVQYSKNGRPLTNEQAYKEIALRATLKQIEQIFPDIESGAFYKKNPIGEVNHFEKKNENSQVVHVESAIRELTSVANSIKGSLSNLNISPKVNLNFIGFSDTTNHEIENSRLVYDPRR
ncbi:MAG: hypothetical protein FD122_2680 [Stygiobacter sp.]|nr:MAG: hypothetical protein FD122_2680 [Stygiobacter sp.]KAF0215215.1 MAG: hypothetical protein FD178_1854 [Ignavibacteria bacterium]